MAEIFESPVYQTEPLCGFVFEIKLLRNVKEDVLAQLNAKLALMDIPKIRLNKSSILRLCKLIESHSIYEDKRGFPVEYLNVTKKCIKENRLRDAVIYIMNGLYRIKR
jgi:hypothetical protein